MAATNTPTTLASKLKEVYPNGPSTIVPSINELHGKRLKFRKDLIAGEKVRFSVELAPESGFSTGQGDITLNGAVAHESAKAEVEGWSVILQSKISYDAITRAKTSKQAFAQFNDSKYVPAAESFRTRCEILSMGYGRQGLGVVDSVAGQVITLKPASWCSTLWMLAKGSTVEAFTATTGGSQHDADLTVGAISIANKTVTVVGTCSSVVDGDILFFKGNRANSPYGLMDIAKNTGSLYNISAATYELWSANHYDVGTSALTIGKVSLASASAADKGCAGEKLTCLVPNKAFQAMVNDEAALRQYGANYNKSKAENGFESIHFHGASGVIEVVPYALCKEGEFVMFPERYTYLIGSEEMTNQIGRDGDIYFDLDNSSSKEMRFFGDWTVFCEKPGFMVYGTRSDSLALHT